MYSTVADLLADETRWTKGCKARSEFNEPVLPSDPLAVKWSLTGAVIVVYYNKPNEFERVVNMLHNHLKLHYSLSFWNDSPLVAHTDVLEAVKAVLV